MLNSILSGRPFKLDMRPIHICFAVLVSYALLTTVIAALVVKFPGYELVANLLELKSALFDWWMIFFVFSQCTRTAADVEALVKTLLIVISVANALTIGQLVGVVNLGREIIGDEFGVSSRICGVFGHANETADLIVFLLPAYIAVAESSSGLRKVFWIGCLTPSVTMLVLAASRAATVGLVLGGLWGALLCSRYLSMQRFMKWISVGAAALVPMLAIVGFKYWDYMLGRWTEGSSASAASMTSGRTEIWAGGLVKMLEAPWTFLTGYGWNVWSTMNFQYVPHNQYLSLWFELGIVGVITIVVIFRQVLKAALLAASVAAPQSNARRHAVAATFAVAMLSIEIFFGTLYIPWAFIWMYMGLAARYSLLVTGERSRMATGQEKHRLQVPGRLPTWTVRPIRTMNVRQH
jgi:hypothetical protein